MGCAAFSRWTAWDGRVARRAFAIAALAFALGWLLTAATDEGGLAWSVRLGRALPLAPACAAVGASLALVSGRSKGEHRALAALGRSPFGCVVAAVFGGSAVAGVAALALGFATRIDVDGFYPRLDRGTRWARENDAFVSEDGEWRVARDGALSRVAGVRTSVPEAATTTTATTTTTTMTHSPPHGRASAALATALMGLALPLFVVGVRRRTVVAAGLVLALTATATVLAFQAAASGRVAAMGVTLPPFLLLVTALASYGAWPWRKAMSRK